jgi:hypothetical protein
MKISILNKNEKLVCKFFLHIAKAPITRIPESKLGGQYEAKTDKGTIQIVLVNFIRYKLDEIPLFFLAMAEGVSDKLSWMDDVIASNRFEADCEVAVYLFEKVSS